MLFTRLKFERVHSKAHLDMHALNPTKRSKMIFNQILWVQLFNYGLLNLNIQLNLKFGAFYSVKIRTRSH